MVIDDRDRMSDFAFKMMSVIMSLKDWLFPGLDQRIAGFGIREGMTVVDYGCGPGRYTTRSARLVGERGKVYAVDVQELALETVKQKIKTQG
jgi:ubiquinone/menaquinone biosynthesis C-methylase UbiE